MTRIEVDVATGVETVITLSPDEEAAALAQAAAVPPAPDLSDVNNTAKAIKALALVTAAWCGKTPAQLQTAFKAAWNSLP